MSDRITALREAIEKIVPEVDGVLALKSGPAVAFYEGKGSVASVAPYLFKKERSEELAALAIWPKEPVPDTLKIIQKAYPEAKLALVCRGCEERGVVEMFKHEQVNLNNVTLIGLQCTTEEASFCRCAKPYTVHAKITVGEKVAGVPDPLTDGFAAKSQPEKLAFWKEEFLHCIKCYGCRTVCPQCFCNVCALEDEKWVSTGRLPMPLPPMYHLVRTMHMTAKCVACRECEETCPAGIPMAIQYRLINRDVKTMFGYETGENMDQKPPQLLTLEEGDFERTGLPH
jgi:formate dehydrogenase (coenzyme F420) beta subunit